MIAARANRRRAKAQTRHGEQRRDAHDEDADQSAYQALTQGEGITVGGVVKPPENVDDRFVPFLALWIQRDRP